MVIVMVEYEIRKSFHVEGRAAEDLAREIYFTAKALGIAEWAQEMERASKGEGFRYLENRYREKAGYRR